MGALADRGARLWWWRPAAGFDLLGRLLAHPIPGRRLHSEHVAFNAEHMLERCRLFLLIALGETVFTTGTAIAAAPLTLLTVVSGSFALIGTVALWSLGFGRAGRATLYHMAKTSNPVLASRHAASALTAMVAGLIAAAVANELVIEDPQAQTSIALTLLLFGGPLIYLTAQGWYLWAVPKVRPRSQLIGTAALLLAGCVALATPAYLALILAGACLAVLAFFDRMAFSPRPLSLAEVTK